MDSKNTFSDILESVILDDSDPTIPVFFILSPGSDPVKEIEKIAKKQKIEPGKNFFNIALG
jgi:dynein heavy chain